MSGCMVADTKTDEIGYVEMSHDAFVFFRPNGAHKVVVTTKPKRPSTAYDEEIVTPRYVIGINYPASQLVRKELKSVDNRPARRRQFLARIDGVTDIAAARDLGYGDTPAPKTIPDGSCDAKAVSASMTAHAASLEGVLDPEATAKAFRMTYGTPSVKGSPSSGASRSGRIRSFAACRIAWKGTGRCSTS